MQRPIPESSSIRTLCQNLDRSGLIAKLQPEDSKLATLVVEPIDSALQDFEEFPELPSGPAANVARAIWASIHPDSAELGPLIESLKDPLPAVRLMAVSGLQVTMAKSNKQWRAQPFAAVALQTLQTCREREESRTISFALKEAMETLAKLGRPSRRPRVRVRVNPYVAGMPVREANKFFGRQDILNQIQNTLGKRPGVKSFVLYGARRSGKTSILLRIMDGALGPNFLPVYVDMQGFAGIGSNVFLSSMARAAASVAADAEIEFDASPLPAPEDPSLRLAVQALLKALTQAASLNVLFLIDEYEVLLEYISADPSIALQFQHLVENEQNLFFIFAGSHPLETSGKRSSVPLLDAARYLKITFLNRPEAIDLVLKPAQGVLTYAEKVPEKLAELTAGHPFYIQLLCQTLFESALAGDGIVTEAMLDDAVAVFQLDPSPHVILTWNALTLDEKVAGSTLAALDRAASPADIQVHLRMEDYPSVPDAASIRKSLTELCEVGWVEENPPQSTYKFTMELVRRWVVANRSIKALADEQRSLLQKRLAPAWRQLSAELLDAVITLVALIPGEIVRASSQQYASSWYASGWALLTFSFCELVVFVCPMMVGRFTVGLRLTNLYPTRLGLGPLNRWHAAAYSILTLIRAAVLVVSAILIVDFSVSRQDLLDTSNWEPAVYGGVGLLIFGLDTLLKFVTPRHRGIYERIGGVQLMYRR